MEQGYEQVVRAKGVLMTQRADERPRLGRIDAGERRGGWELFCWLLLWSFRSTDR